MSFLCNNDEQKNLYLLLKKGQFLDGLYTKSFWWRKLFHNNNNRHINLFRTTTLRTQSFTSLKADLRQDINGGFALSRCLNGTFPWRKCSVKALVFWLMYQCLNRAIPSRKYSIKTPANWRNSVYVLTEICDQRSKWLGP